MAKKKGFAADERRPSPFNDGGEVARNGHGGQKLDFGGLFFRNEEQLSGLYQSNVVEGDSSGGVIISPAPQVVISPEIIPTLQENSSAVKRKVSSAVKVQTSTTNPDNRPDDYGIPDFDKDDKAKKIEEKIRMLEDRPKFKIPEFEKFDGNSCPSAHITMFCRKMTGYGGNDQLLIHCFQESLSGSAIRWYNQLSQNYIKTWRDLAKSFLEQYKYINDMRPDRVMLQGLEKKHNESFRQYAQRWKDLSVQVHPPLDEKETRKLFVQTLKTPYFGHLVAITSGGFSDLVMAGEMIELAIKQGKIEGGDSMSPYPMDPMKPPYPRWYDENANCEYHGGVQGHSIEGCLAFKRLVQRMRNKNWITFNSETPNVAQNPLPNHPDTGINAITTRDGRRVKTNVSEVKTSLTWVWNQMIKAGFLIPQSCPTRNKGGNYCCYHNKEGHKVQGCSEFRTLVQFMMDHKELEFYEEVQDSPEADICATEGASDKRFGRGNPLIITPKAKISTVVPQAKVEAKEFLKFLKHSEYSVVEQLHNLPTRTSILALLLSSEAHREALLKVLNQTFVPQDIPVSKMDRLVNNIQADNLISFSDDEIPSGGRGRTKALHITTYCKGHALPSVLIDNGSALNVMPLATLKRLPIDTSHMRACQNVVRAFDGTKREVIGKIEVPLTIGPATYNIEFLVMDIMPSYNCLLGRPWIHQAGAVPSTLHQKVKFVIDGALVIINAEEDKEERFLNPRLSKCTRMEIIQTLGQGAKTGRGFGKFLQGRIDPVLPISKPDRFGLGFQPSYHERRKEVQKNREIRLARLTGRELQWEPMTFPPLCHTFKTGGYVFETTPTDLETDLEELSINVVTTGNADDIVRSGICPLPPGFVPSSWTVEELPVFYKNFSDTEGECNLPTELLRMVEREDEQILPHKETIEILNLGTEEDRKEVKIGTTLSTEARQNLINLLQEYKEVFAWSYQDMPGLDTDMVVHKLPIKPECKPVQQKMRRMRPEMLLKIKEEVKKQFDAGFLQVAKYPEWVANIVPVPKKDGKVRMCVDYRDLNKASPKDNFPLPHIDTLVDNTAGNNYFSFMDGFSGYNQIKMHPEDMEKTTFVTMWGTFCYKVMPFGLKNAGATYQRAMVTLFHDMMHKEIEVYVDDMIIKAQTENEHVEHLRKLFQRLRKFQLRLNPNKCTFGVTSGKLLGFVVRKEGIEVDPDKIKAIQNLPPPRTQKEVRGFLGRLNYIARFISQLTDKCDPIFRLLRKNNPGAWNENCQIAFEKVKEYLSHTPVLMSPIPGKPLFLYLSIFENSMGCVLGQHDESRRKERAIYYLSKKFTDCEVRYPPIEKVCCALVWATKRLRQYMLYHTTWLISKLDPLKYMMGVPALSGRLARWQMLLSEFDIEYVSQKAIKGSAISDFLASRTDENYEPLDFDFPDEDLMALSLEEAVTSTDNFWRMYFDGASNALGHGIGAILISPEGGHYPFTSRLNFDCTNNMAEYEACVLGIRAALGQSIRTLRVYGDSALVIYQLRGEWETKDTKLIEYRKLMLDLLEEFDEVTFHYVPREENQMADALATLAAAFKLGNPSILIQLQTKQGGKLFQLTKELAEFKANLKNVVITRNHLGNPSRPPINLSGGRCRFTTSPVIDISRSSYSLPQPAPIPQSAARHGGRHARQPHPHSSTPEPMSSSSAHHSSDFMVPPQGSVVPSESRKN
ncbi:uncharacterized protein LOC120189633 [Hibiscus syriacus]|uniref:uncharacterized protein LOC120189633 n=1 Tax=Hibiscus syriacus TaxID=106335 RepID=UPI001921FDF3|nr:uncharacterized protein LOC120189633 [Hibiscus syriacus]